MPFILIRAFKRTQEQKERLAKAITKDVCEIFDITGDKVSIYFEEAEKSNWFRNGTPATK